MEIFPYLSFIVRLRILSLVVEPSSFFKDARLLIAQFYVFSNLHAYHYQLRCGAINSKGVPAILPLLLEPKINPSGSLLPLLLLQ